MSNIPNLNEMLKLWTKKDLWERIQQHIQTIDQLKQDLKDHESFGLALYSVLYEKLEKEDPENVSSRIQFLTGQKKSLYDDTYKTIKNLQQELAELKEQRNYKFDNEQKVKAYLDTLTKPKIIELCLQYIYDKNIIEQQLAEKDKMHLLDEQEFQHYCAYKNIEPEIKGCLDREREYKKQLAEKNLELKKWSTQYAVAYVNRQNALIAEKVELQQQLEDKNKELEKTKQNQTQLAIQKLEKVKELLLVENKNNPIVYDINDDTVGGALDRDKTFEIIDQQIKELKGE